MLKNKKLISIIIAAMIVFVVAAPSRLVKSASVEEWMKSAKTIPINRKSEIFDIVIDTNNDHFDDAFYFYLPEKQYVKASITFGGVDYATFSIKNSSGDTVIDGSSCGGVAEWKYNKSADEVGTTVTGVLDKGDYYIKFYSSNINNTYVYFNINTFIPAIEKITSIKKKGKNSITIKWKKTTGAEGYIIYRASSKNGKYKKIKTIYGNKGKAVVGGVKAKKRYYYMVVAYRTVGDDVVYTYKNNKKKFVLK